MNDRVEFSGDWAAELDQAVRRQLGEDLLFLSGMADSSTVIVADLWRQNVDRNDERVHPGALCALSLANDAVKASLRDLTACDLLAVYSSLRRSTEHVVLATAIGLDARIGDAWILGKAMPQSQLRRVVEAERGGAGERIRLLYSTLSEYTHGHVNALALYANRWSWFEWPRRPDGYDPDLVRVAADAVGGLLLHHWDAFRIVTREWTVGCDATLREFATAEERGLAAYMRHFTEGGLGHLTTRLVAEGLAEEWLERSNRRPSRTPDPNE